MADSEPCLGQENESLCMLHIERGSSGTSFCVWFVPLHFGVKHDQACFSRSWHHHHQQLCTVSGPVHSSVTHCWPMMTQPWQMNDILGSSVIRDANTSREELSLISHNASTHKKETLAWSVKIHTHCILKGELVHDTNPQTNGNFEIISHQTCMYALRATYRGNVTWAFI